jgi:hypothetical protein
MRRTGKDFESPATGIEACCGAGITKAVVFMKGISAGVAEVDRLVFTRLR